MSAVPVQKPFIVTRPRTRPQLRIEQGVQPSVSSRLMARTIVFSLMTLGFFLSSSLAGQVMVEKARRDGIRAVERSRAAMKEEALLRDKIEMMTRASAVDAWASEHGLVPADAIVAEQPSTAEDEKHDAEAQR